MTNAATRNRRVLPPDQISLKAHGRVQRGWTVVSAGRSLEAAVSTFAFTAAPRWPTEPNPVRVLLGSPTPVEVYVGDQKVITGFAERVGSRGDKTQLSINVNGRSKTADIVDSNPHKAERFKNRTLYQIAKELCAPFGVEVVVSPEIATAPELLRVFSSFRAPATEKVFSIIEKAARSRGVLLTDDEEGRLLLTRATKTTKAKTALVMGENVVAWDVSFDSSDLYSSIIVRGQRAPVDGDSGLSAFGVSATVEEPLLQERTRVLQLKAEGAADAERNKRRAQWEAASRFGKAYRLGYTVQGWLMGDGALWRPNLLVDVHDTRNSVSGTFLIHEVKYGLTGDGSRTELRLAPREAFDLLEPSQRKGTGRSGAWKEISSGVDLGGG